MLDPTPSSSPIACKDYLPQGPAAEDFARQSLTKVALGLVGSEILKIAAEIRQMVAGGAEICNLTVGDFAPSQFPIPKALQQLIDKAYERRETNYPPSDGVLQVREAVAAFYRRALKLDYPLAGIIITGGARPAIYATYRALIERGERVIYPTPSWNNNHYCHLVEATPVALQTSEADRFMPTSAQLRPLLPSARLLCLNSPLNPTGTMLDKDELTRICQLIVEENHGRKARGERLLYLMYDQVYFLLTFGGALHVTPIEVCPEVAPFTVFVDGISKCLAATGLRVGWIAAPPAIAARMRDLLGHVGAWAPRPEQIAVGEMLADEAAMAAYHKEITFQLQERLNLLYQGFTAMRERGLPVSVIPPQGAIYLSAQFRLPGKTNEEIRQLLLREAGMAVVPFQAFGMGVDTGWMRLSVGAVSTTDIEKMLPRVEKALQG